MRTPIMAGNWKMYKTPEEATTLAKSLIDLVKDNNETEILLCPATASLQAVSQVIADTNIKLGGQNLYPMAEGAFTGETSPSMLRALGAQFCIIGHSERRQYFGETNQFINRKVKAAMEFGIVPILCVGESLEERETKRTFEIVGYQIDSALNGIQPSEAISIVVAYEPIWAIGTGKTATPDMAQEVHHFIRAKLARLFDADTADQMRIQYGGSVKPGNVDDLMAQPDIDGALVGGASLDAESFARIVNFEAK